MATPNLSAITTVTPKILASSQVAAALTDTTAYTVPANTACKIATVTLTNTSTTVSVTINLGVHPVATAVDGTHRVLSGLVLAAGDTTAVTELAGAWMGAGDFLNVNASVAAVLDVVATGLEMS